MFTFEGPTDLANIERIEVLKGPSAILYGRGEPGGVVNFVIRTPTLFENRFSLQQQIGSYEFYRTQLNANWAPVPDSLAIRLDGAYENSESFIDFVEGERFFIAPALLWQIGDNTALTFRGEYSNDDRSSSTGFPFIDGRVLPGVPYSRYFGEPDDSIINFETWRGLLTLDHRWNESHVTKLSLHGVLTEADGLNLLLFNFAGPVQDPDTGEISRIAELVDFSGEYFTARLDHVWDATIYAGNTSASSGFGFPEVKNQLLISAEFDSQTNKRERILSGHTPLDPFDPNYTGYSPLPLVPIPDFPTTFGDNAKDEGRATSILLIDRVSFGEKVFLSLGGRYESFEAESRFAFTGTDAFGPGAENELDEDTFNPFVGLLVKPLSSLSLYAAYAESTYSFQNIGLRTVSGESLDPERSRLFETGLKAELLDGNVFATLSLFQIDKRDVAGTDSDNPFFSINAGEERSRGVEFDITGEPLPGLLVTANYAYIDAEITDDPADLNTGNRLSGVPEHSGGLFATYEIRRGILNGLGLGGGVFVSDSVQVNNANTGDLDDWAQTDVLIFYRREHVSLQVNVKNLFDEEFFFAGGGEGDTTEVQRAAPRAVIATLRVQF